MNQSFGNWQLFDSLPSLAKLIIRICNVYMDAVHIEASILQLVYTVFIKPPLHHLHSLLPAKQELIDCPLAELAGREKDKPECSHFDGR